jgi:hypothetical protein
VSTGSFAHDVRRDARRLEQWAAMTDAYIGYFPRYLPARNAFTTNGPTPGGRIELACTATRTGTK